MIDEQGQKTPSGEQVKKSLDHALDIVVQLEASLTRNNINQPTEGAIEKSTAAAKVLLKLPRTFSEYSQLVDDNSLSVSTSTPDAAEHASKLLIHSFIDELKKQCPEFREYMSNRRQEAAAAR